VDISIYTPGSNAGLPLTVLRCFGAPAPAVRENTEALRDRVLTAASGLLGLLGLETDPLRSREHTFLSTLLDRAWREGRDLDLAALIRGIQSPPFDKIGVMDLESTFPAADRHALALQLNNLLASPGFSAWLEGEPLDVQRLLYSPEGRPRLSVISIAHLPDAQRMFFVTALLNEVTAWVRTQAGTSSLRALLYMDEVFGYFPPTANPPSKTPMLTLLKQARAYGLGIVLATQNPVDLDYKGLSNAGTWFLGRLQTDRDKARVLDGLEGAASTAGTGFDRDSADKMLSALGNRVFLMNNVHENAPVVFQSRWALSFLRGPLTRAQIETLMRDRKAATAAVSAPATSPARSLPSHNEAAGDLPVLPPGIVQRFAMATQSIPQGSTLLYRPALLGRVRLHYVSSPVEVDDWRTQSLLVDAGRLSADNVWQEAEILDVAAVRFQDAPAAPARFADLPAELRRPKSHVSWKTALKNHVYQTATLTLWQCQTLKESSRSGESAGDFRVRLRQKAAEQRDAELDKLRNRYAPKVRSLEQRIRRAEQQVEREKSQTRDQTLQTAVSFGATVFGALFGRKLRSSSNITRAASSMRSAGRVAREQADVTRAMENLEALRQQLRDLQADVENAANALREKLDVDQLEITELPLRPRKSDLTVDDLSLAWIPGVVDSQGLFVRAC
jgi:hypothetical protein